MKAFCFSWMMIATCLVGGVRAEVINFDDISDNGTGTPIQNGYHGFNWNNLYALNVQAFSAMPYIGANGYLNGLVSGPNVAFNGYSGKSDTNGDGGPALVSSGLFTFNSAYFNSAWNDGMSITVTGKLAGKVVDEKTFIVSADSPATTTDPITKATLEVFNWSRIDEVDFTASGGTPHAGYNGMGAHFVMDNFDVTPLVTLLVPTADPPSAPEPSRVVGLAGLGGVAIAFGMLRGLRRRRSSSIAVR